MEKSRSKSAFSSQTIQVSDDSSHEMARCILKMDYSGLKCTKMFILKMDYSDMFVNGWKPPAHRTTKTNVK